MENQDEREVLTKGVQGTVGPNEYGYIHKKVYDAAKLIRAAQELYSQGHYGHSNAKIISEHDDLRLVMNILARLDKQYCFYANKKPDVAHFSTYDPPKEDTQRWGGVQGSAGITEPLLINVDSTIVENFGEGFTRSEKNTDIAW